MCCSSKSVEVIDSSSRYPTQHGNYKKSINGLFSNKSSQIDSNNNDDNMPKTSNEKKTLISKGERPQKRVIIQKQLNYLKK